MGMAAFNAMRRRRKAEEAAKAKQQAQQVTVQQAKPQGNQGASSDTVSDKSITDDKPIGKMTVAELEAKAAELELVFPEDVTNKAQKAAFLTAHLENKG